MIQGYAHLACPLACMGKSYRILTDTPLSVGISQTLSAAKGELYRTSDQTPQQNLTWTDYAQMDPGACPPILCKVRKLTTAACQVYKVCCGHPPTTCSFHKQCLSARCSACTLPCKATPLRPVCELVESMSELQPAMRHPACQGQIHGIPALEDRNLSQWLLRMYQEYGSEIGYPT